MSRDRAPLITTSLSLFAFVLLVGPAIEYGNVSLTIATVLVLLIGIGNGVLSTITRR